MMVAAAVGVAVLVAVVVVVEMSLLQAEVKVMDKTAMGGNCSNSNCNMALGTDTWHTQAYIVMYIVQIVSSSLFVLIVAREAEKNLTNSLYLQIAP
jgi:mannose/fructose/N-acetylgalactosamine-specific phosphotransferase system component IIC